MLEKPHTLDAFDLPALKLFDEAEADAFVERLREGGFEYLRFEMPDMAGLSRGKTIPINHVKGYLCKGLNLYGGTVALDSYSNPVRESGYNEERNFTDCVMVADLDTLTAVPWLERTCRVICDTMWYDGTPQWASPRMLMKKMLQKFDDLGYIVKMGHEYEFYAVDPDTREPLFSDQPIFVTARTHQHGAIDELIRTLQAQGIDIITWNAEHGPGQIEINYSALDGVAAADRAFVFKNTVKEYLPREGLLPTFMTKPYKGRSGSCSHFHLSLLHKDTGLNAFLDTSLEDGLSSLMRQFIQGILDHTRAAMAIWSPTPNCYRRIRPRTYAPSNISWGVQDRSASVRVKASYDQATHFEVRVPSAMANPYLVSASVLAAGLLGILQKSELAPAAAGPKEDDSRFEKLPTSIEDALEALEADLALREMLGEEFIQVYLKMKWQETNRLRDEIPAAETAEYFDLY